MLGLNLNQNPLSTPGSYFFPHFKANVFEFWRGKYLLPPQLFTILSVEAAVFILNVSFVLSSNCLFFSLLQSRQTGTQGEGGGKESLYFSAIEENTILSSDNANKSNNTRKIIDGLYKDLNENRVYSLCFISSPEQSVKTAFWKVIHHQRKLQLNPCGLHSLHSHGPSGTKALCLCPCFLLNSTERALLKLGPPVSLHWK